MSGFLGDILVEAGDITGAQLKAALQSKAPGQYLGDRLLEQGFVSSRRLGEALAQQFGVPYSQIDPESLNLQIMRLLPEAFLRSRNLAPCRVDQNRLTVAMVSPDDIETISETELMTGYCVDAQVALQAEVTQALDRAFDERALARARQTAIDVRLEELQGATEEAAGADDEALDDAGEAPVVRLVKSVLLGAVSAGCSDIHLEPEKPEMRVRYRIDGELQQTMTIPSHIEEAVIARIKVMADMNTTEQRRPQDGQLIIDDDGHRVNFRVSCIPTIGGEKVVLRLLDEGSKTFRLDELGFSERDSDRLHAMLDKPHGMFVVTGPTGSGKSTTLYAALARLNEIKRNIVTVEDPVEYQLPGINQVQSDSEFGMGFANALKFIMRQDPDVIMLGEIRDHETATTAVQAALTGHLLLSTLHTNDAVGAVTRLIDLGVDAFKVGGALLGSIAQRLLRTTCAHCRDVAAPNPGLLGKISECCPVPADATFYAGTGCSKCMGTGYAGRTSIFEVMSVTPEIADAITTGMPVAKVRELAIKDGMVELIGSGVAKALSGETTLEEVYFKTLG